MTVIKYIKPKDKRRYVFYDGEFLYIIGHYLSNYGEHEKFDFDNGFTKVSLTIEQVKKRFKEYEIYK